MVGFEIGGGDLFYVLLPIVAFIYAGVGHGGASGYLALMALFSFPEATMKSTALLLNLFVAAASFYQFWREGHFKWQLFLWFAIGSIPCSFYGGQLEVDPSIYKKILGVLLIFAILKILNVFGRRKLVKIRSVEFWQGLTIGGLIGFFSGLIGIGGGIILSPVILLMRWGTIKEAAAVSALFIWVNSASGMAGQLKSGVMLSSNTFGMVALALIGGFVGAYFGSKRWNNKVLRWLLAAVLVLALVKLMLT